MNERLHISTAFAPSQDKKDRFFSTTPTSLAWAIAPLISAIDQGKLEHVSYDATIFDPLRMASNTLNDFRNRMEQESPNLLLLSSTYDSHWSAVQLAQIAREINPDIVIVYGGPHVNEVCNERVIKAMPQVYPFNETNCPFDILVEGEGESVLMQLAEDMTKYSDKRALLRYLATNAMEKYWHLHGRARLHFLNAEGSITHLITGGAALDLSTLAFMPRHMFGQEMDDYGFSCFTELGDDGKSILLKSTSTMLHRGCKSHCIYCSEAGGFNQRGLTHIIAELEELKSKGYKGIFFDDSTLSDHEGMDELLVELGRIGLQYGSLNRFDKLESPDYVARLRAAGFVYQYCSIEQFDNQVLKLNGKAQGVQSMQRAVANLEREKISLGVSLLFGLRSETTQSVESTLQYTAKLVDAGVIQAVSMSLYSYHPKTPLTLKTPEGMAMQGKLRYDQQPPNQGAPWSSFEEGQWFHPEWVTPEYVEKIWLRASELFGNKLVRNMQKDGTPAIEEA